MSVQLLLILLLVSVVAHFGQVFQTRVNSSNGLQVHLLLLHYLVLAHYLQ